jgi:hypothetical protein
MGEICIIRKFMIFMLHQMLSEGWNWLGMLHASETGKCIQNVSRKAGGGGDYFIDLGIDGKIILQ